MIELHLGWILPLSRTSGEYRTSIVAELCTEEETTTYWMGLFANRPHSLQDDRVTQIIFKNLLKFNESNKFGCGFHKLIPYGSMIKARYRRIESYLISLI